MSRFGIRDTQLRSLLKVSEVHTFVPSRAYGAKRAVQSTSLQFPDGNEASVGFLEGCLSQKQLFRKTGQFSRNEQRHRSLNLRV